MKELSIRFILVFHINCQETLLSPTEEAVFVLFGGILGEVGGFLISGVIVVLLR